MIAIDWVLFVVLVYGGVMLLLFAALHVSGAEDEASDRALAEMLRQRNSRLVPMEPSSLAMEQRHRAHSWA